MQTYPLIGIAGNHRQDNTEEDRYIYRMHQMVLSVVLKRQMQFLSSFPSVPPNLQKNSFLDLMDFY